jgi:hypothetical protein
MQFEINRSDAGQFHWGLVGDRGAKRAASATPLGSARDAQRAAADMRLHRGGDGTEARR